MSEEIYEIAPDLYTECVGHYDKPTCISVFTIDCIDPDHNESDD